MTSDVHKCFEHYATSLQRREPTSPRTTLHPQKNHNSSTEKSTILDRLRLKYTSLLKCENYTATNSLDLDVNKQTIQGKITPFQFLTNHKRHNLWYIPYSKCCNYAQ